MDETALVKNALVDVYHGIRITRVETIPLPFDGCSVRVPDAPGLGLTLDEGRIRASRVDR